MTMINIIKLTPKECLSVDRMTEVTVSDGVLELTPTELAINRLLWNLVLKLDMPIVTKYSITEYYTEGYFSNNSIQDAIGAMVLDVLLYKTGKAINDDMMMNMASDIFKAINWIYNNIAMMSKEYESSMPASDFVNVQFDKDLMIKLEELKKNPSPAMVKEVYLSLDEAVHNAPSSNQMAVAYEAGTSSKKQLRQCFLRGYASDLNGAIFKEPITSGYILGIRNIAELAMETRGAATALSFASTAIRNSEAFAKKSQLQAGIITELEYTDCGSKEGLPFIVTPPGINQYNDFYAGDFGNIIGQQFKFKDSDEWRLITPEVKSEIVGKPILIRTTISCQLKDKQHVCVECFGKHGYNKPMPFNLGNWSSTQFNEPATQSLLSTKHYIVSADGGVYVLDDTEREYLLVSENLIYLDFDKLDVKNTVLIVSKKELHSISDLRQPSDVDGVDSARISKVTTFTLEHTGKDGVKRAAVISAKKGTKFPIFSTAFLKHAVTVGYETTNTSYIIKLKGFTRRKPLLYVPDTMFDYKKYNEELRNLLLKSTKNNKERVHTTGAMTLALFDTVNSKLSAHISILATIAYSLSAESEKDLDFTLMRGIDAKISKLQPILRFRSLSTLYNYGTIKSVLSPYVMQYRALGKHPLDCVFKPREVVEHARRKMIKK